MGQALYRKYRSKSLKEIIGQEHITDTLSEALKQGRISHAYLFTGPRGVGKTSIARILAHEINDLPYVDDSTHIDIIEIDAASNRRIDEIRELREKVHVAPTSAKYKVYIIDEVHMLTREAFNALLKTLEEPPEHAVFILATTDAHKLPETIVSRTQRFSFKPVEKAKVVAHLKEIAQKEGIKVRDDALELLAEHGEGSFRDSISLLDQASSHGKELKLEDIQRLLGLPPEKTLQSLLSSLGKASAASIMQQITALYDQGFQAASIAKQLGSLIRHELVNNRLIMDRSDALSLLDKLLQVPAAHNPDRYLEICLLEYAAIVDGPTPQPEPEPEAEQAAEEMPPAPPKVEAEEAVVGTAELGSDIWPEVLTALKQKHNTLYGVIRMAEPEFGANGSLKLTFAFPFHQKRGNESANRQKLADIVQQLTGQAIKIECVLDPNAKPADISPVVKKADNGHLSTISNIFGEAELLES